MTIKEGDMSTVMLEGRRCSGCRSSIKKITPQIPVLGNKVGWHVGKKVHYREGAPRYVCSKCGCAYEGTDETVGISADE